MEERRRRLLGFRRTLVRILPANGICPHRSDALLLLPGSGFGALAGIDLILGGIMK